MPFTGDDSEMIKRAVLSRPLALPRNHGVAPTTVTMLHGLLAKKPMMRLSMEAAKAHWCFAGM